MIRLKTTLKKRNLIHSRNNIFSPKNSLICIHQTNSSIYIISYKNAQRRGVFSCRICANAHLRGKGCLERMSDKAAQIQTIYIYEYVRNSNDVHFPNPKQLRNDQSRRFVIQHNNTELYIYCNIQR